MNQTTVICDDLTGAMEAGLQLCKKGFRVYVLIDNGCLGRHTNDADAFVIDTESRNVSPEQAERKIAQTWQKIAQAGLTLVYKKVDSTLRGNLGKEMEVILRQSDFEMIVFAPALPFNGRTTKKSCHYFNGNKLIESDLAKDPFSPITDSYIPNILKQQTATHVEAVLLEDVRKGMDFLGELFNELHLKGCRVAIVDVETDDDLRVISAALTKSVLKILPCGSAGLFAEMTLPSPAPTMAAVRTGDPAQTLHKCPKIRQDKPVLIISGSPARMTKQQIRVAAEQGLPIIRPDIRRLLTLTTPEQEIQETIYQASLHLKKGESVIIDGAGDGKEEIAVQYSEDSSGLVKDSQKIQELLSRIFEKVVAETEIAGAMIIGGDTLNGVCQKMKVEAIRIANEVEPFIPVGIMHLEHNKVIPIVSKAGGFGSQDVITEAIRYLQGS
jgi:D-threonate/D-erythronate kinase